MEIGFPVTTTRALFESTSTVVEMSMYGRTAQRQEWISRLGIEDRIHDYAAIRSRSSGGITVDDEIAVNGRPIGQH
jgi:hypothetical protein